MDAVLGVEIFRVNRGARGRGGRIRFRDDHIGARTKQKAGSKREAEQFHKFGSADAGFPFQ
jgi:hypothetical protein